MQFFSLPEKKKKQQKPTLLELHDYEDSYLCNCLTKFLQLNSVKNKLCEFMSLHLPLCCQSQDEWERAFYRLKNLFWLSLQICMQAGHDQMLLMKSSWNTGSNFLRKNLVCRGVGASFGSVAMLNSHSHGQRNFGSKSKWNRTKMLLNTLSSSTRGCVCVSMCLDLLSNTSSSKLVGID